MDKSKKDVIIYTCKTCHWQGNEEELEEDITETCFGNDTIHCCPKCGSYEVKIVN